MNTFFKNPIIGHFVAHFLHVTTHCSPLTTQRSHASFPPNKRQKNQKIFEKYLEDPSQVLREVDIFGIIFETWSQMKEDLWYTMSTESKQFDCVDTQSSANICWL